MCLCVHFKILLLTTAVSLEACIMYYVLLVICIEQNSAKGSHVGS